MSPPPSLSLMGAQRGVPAVDDRDAQVASSGGWLIEAPSRLHLGFLDPAASLGRRFGSVGVVIDGFPTRLRIGPSPVLRCVAHPEVASAAAEAAIPRILAHVQALVAASGRDDAFALEILALPPAHAGLGSGTQLALAVGTAFVRWHGLNWDTATVARHLGRGARSGIGVGGFDLGGLLVDAGPDAQQGPAPIISRMDFPASWPMLLLMDPARRGLSGEEERAALATLPPLSQAQAADLCHHVLMQLLPDVARHDFAAFARGVNHLQVQLGAHFAPAQEGRSYTSPAVDAVMRTVVAAMGSRVATGQSSWGPTAFAVVPDEAQALTLSGIVEVAARAHPGLTWRWVSGQSCGAAVTALPAQALDARLST